MDIAQYISTILQEQDEVGVPGIGTFYKKKAAARFDSGSQKFFPPGVQLSFREEQTTDTSLSRFISKTKNLSQPSAEYFAEKFGSELKRQLLASETIDLNGLGSLRKSDDGISFEAKAASFSLEGFGLTAVAEPEHMLSTGHLQVDTLPAKEPFNSPETEEKETPSLPGAYPPGSIATDIPAEPVAEEPAIETEQENISEESIANEAPEPVVEEPAPASADHGLPGEEDATAELTEQLQQDVHSSPEPFSEQADEGKPSVTEKEAISGPAVPGRLPSANIFDYRIPLEKDYASNVNILEPAETTGAEIAEKKSGWLKLFIAAVIVSGITFAGYYYRDTLNALFLKPNTTNAEDKQVLPIEPAPIPQDSVAVADSTMEALKKAGLNPEKPQDTANITTKPEEINAPGAVRSFDIIGPSFAKPGQAEAYIKNMRTKGVDAYVLQGLPGPLMKIGLGSFKDEASAALELPRIQKDIYAGAYIQQVKNKTNP